MGTEEEPKQCLKCDGELKPIAWGPPGNEHEGWQCKDCRATYQEIVVSGGSRPGDESLAARSAARFLAEISKDSVKISYDGTKGNVKTVEVKCYATNGIEAAKRGADALVATIKDVEESMKGTMPKDVMERIPDGSGQ